MARLDAATIRKDFPIFERTIGGKQIHFLDSGAGVVEEQQKCAIS